MSLCAPKPRAANTTFRNETVNMWIPFQVTTESMKDEDESGSEIFGFIVFKEQAKNNTLNSFEEKRKKISIFEKEMSELGYNYGSGNQERFIAIERFTKKCCLIVGILAAALFFVLREPIIQMFINDKDGRTGYTYCKARSGAGRKTSV